MTKQQVQYPGKKGTSEKKERPSNHFVCKLEAFGKQNRGANFAAEKQEKNIKSALSSEKKIIEEALNWGYFAKKKTVLKSENFYLPL